MVRQRNGPRTGRRTAAHQGGGGDAVVRLAKRPLAPVLGLKLPGQTQHRRRFQGLLLGQRGQQSHQPLRQHGLAAARRPHHQEAVAACGGDLQGAFGIGLTAHIAQIQAAMVGRWLRPSRRLQALPAL